MLASAADTVQYRLWADGSPIRNAGRMDATSIRVGILAPMPSELAPVVKTMRLTRDAEGTHVGRVGGVEVVAMRTGMGLTLATAAATRLLDGHAVDHVMVVGIAGGLGPTRVGEVVCPTVVIDRTTRAEFSATPMSIAAGRISSSDDFVVDADLVAALVRDGVRAVDMETSAIAAVCTARGCSWSAVRVISDLVTDHPDDAVLGLANPDGSPNTRAALKFMATHPGRIPQLLRLGRDATSAARVAANEAARQLREIVAG
jgi:Nucleoside phosphorylase